MTTEEFLEVWCNTELRQYVINQAKRHSRDVHLQEDFVQEAWVMISLAEANMSLDIYKNIAYNAIRNEYRRCKNRRFYTCPEEELDYLKYKAWEKGIISKY